MFAKPFAAYLKQFPSYSNHKCKKTQFSRTAAHIFVSPGDALAIITQYVAWMERKFNAYQIPRSMYLYLPYVPVCMYLYVPVFNSFPVIRTAGENRRFHVPQPTFLFLLETPLRLSPNIFHGCQTPRSMYLSIFNSFRVIRRLS